MTPSRLLVAPATLAGEPDPIVLVAARAAADRLTADGELLVGMLEGDLASQHAVESELAREGLDRGVLGREGFIERVRTAEARRRDALVAALGEADIDVDPERGRTAGEAVVRAARTAFVRLYDAGLLERAERVVDICARCQTVVEPSDAIAVATEVTIHRLGLNDGIGGPFVNIDFVDLELLPGVVAIAVPADHEAAGGVARVPLGRDVPVIADDTTDVPWFVIPAHSAASLQFARNHSLVPVAVLSNEGSVTCDGPLAGLARFAARAAATEVVVAEGAIFGTVVDSVDQARCGRCATSLVPILGWHWFLRTADLEVAVADALREGAFALEDVEARDYFVDRAERADSWCLSHQVVAGDTVPAARCLDCGQIAVTADPSSSCNKCMGEMVSTDDVLDARFLAALWPLADAGWPGDERAAVEAASATVVFAGRDDVIGFALPAAALGLRLTGAVPFHELVPVYVPGDGPVTGEVPIVVVERAPE